MKKYILTTILLVSASLAANAQSHNEPKLNFGLTLGIAIVIALYSAKLVSDRQKGPGKKAEG
ncbi:MAG: hypothetical protein JST70_08130 [Bacteroidetes bacterium]|nr:hypothetical protein [Bacteroidota bacterium]